MQTHDVANDVANDVARAVYSNATKLTTTSSRSGHPRLLSIPAGGPAGVGSAKIAVEAARNVARKLARGCRNGRNPTAAFELEDHDAQCSHTAGTKMFRACDLTRHGSMNWSVDMLSPGNCVVFASVGKYSGIVSFTILYGPRKVVNEVFRRS